MTVSAVDGQPLPSVVVRIGSQAATSDAEGSFQFQSVPPGQQTVTVSGSGVVDRQTSGTFPMSGLLRESLIPSNFDLAAFDQMCRGNGRLQRWQTAPALVILTRTMQYDAASSGDEYYATSEQMTDAEVDLLIQHFTEGLAMLTGNTFTAFSSIERETPQPGDKVSTNRAGKIVAGRYKGVQTLASTIGFGRWATDATGTVVGGAIFLDRDFDRSSDQRRLLRIHELGHALGYQHVTARVSIMNPVIGPDATAFDKQAAAIAFERRPGNQSPDSDPDTSVRSAPGGIFTLK